MSRNRSVSKRPSWTTSRMASPTRWKIGAFIPYFADIYQTCIISATVPLTEFVIELITLAGIACFDSSPIIGSRMHRGTNASMGLPSRRIRSASSPSSSIWSLFSVLSSRATVQTCIGRTFSVTAPLIPSGAVWNVDSRMVLVCRIMSSRYSMAVTIFGFSHIGQVTDNSLSC